MTNFGGALWAELRKVRRSKMLWLTALGFSIAPAAGGLFMLILKNPEWAMQAGIISTKARLLAGTADWPSFMSLVAQAMAGGGMVVFGLITAWIFGREYAERTAADLMALPTSRSVIVLAKFTVMAAWSAALAVWVLVVAVAVGLAVRMPPTTSAFILGQLRLAAMASLMTIVLMPPFAFLASAGRGYLAAMGGLFVALIFAQFSSVMGRGEFFPWAVPILYTGAAGPDTVIGPVSVAIVLITGLAGVAATLLWWQRADQIV